MKILEKDYLENAVAGNNVLVIDATKCMVHAPDKKLLVLQGLDDYIIVDTDDVLLICKKDKEQEIKEYVCGGEAEYRRSVFVTPQLLKGSKGICKFQLNIICLSFRAR